MVEVEISPYNRNESYIPTEYQFIDREHSWKSVIADV